MRGVAVVLIALSGWGCGGGGRGGARSGVPPTFGFGRSATAPEITAWDIDVRPDGLGLPPGSGTARAGAAIYAARCAMCHGATGSEARWPNPKLVGREPRQGFPFGRNPRLVKTVGNYWPFATTLYDYINRAMPLNAPGSLTPDEVYGVVAYVLWRNEIIADTAVIDARTLPQVVMPARDRFVIDECRGGPGIR